MSERSETISENYAKTNLAYNLHGAVYQLKLLMYFFLRALNSGNDFTLGTEWKKFGKLNDVVLLYDTKANDTDSIVAKAVLMQTKHTQVNNTIKIEDLTADDGDFSIKTYFKCYHELMKELGNRKIEAIFIVTNVNLEEEMKNCLDKVESKNNLSSLVDFTEKCETYRIIDSNKVTDYDADKYILYNELKKEIGKATDEIVLARELSAYLKRGTTKISGCNQVFEKHRQFLCQNVFEYKNGKTIFRKQFENATDNKFKKIIEDFLSDKRNPRTIKTFPLKIANNFAQKFKDDQIPLKLNDLVEPKEIEEFLKKIRFIITPKEKKTVRKSLLKTFRLIFFYLQTKLSLNRESELDRLIKKELAGMFHQKLIPESNEIDFAYCMYLDYMLDWFESRSENGNDKGLTKDIGEKYFKNLHKRLLP